MIPSAYLTWFEFAEKVEACKSIHTAIFGLMLHRCAGVRTISVSTDFYIRTLSIGDKETYLSALRDIAGWGFIKIVYEAKNQHQNTLIEICHTENLTADYYLTCKKIYDENQKKPSLHSALRKIIEQENPGYYWQAKDGSALKRLIAKMKFRWQAKHLSEPLDDDIENSFKWLIFSLPEFYRDKWDTCLLDSKFESIIKEITENRKNGQHQPNSTNGSGTSGISDRLAEGIKRLAERRNGQQ